MPIHWFPGHMHSTKKAIVERLPDIDVVIELLDARLPGSSANPLLADLTAGKPALKLLNKQDLADPELTAQWLAHYQARPGTRALALDASSSAPARLQINTRTGLTMPPRNGASSRQALMSKRAGALLLASSASARVPGRAG